MFRLLSGTLLSVACRKSHEPIPPKTRHAKESHESLPTGDRRRADSRHVDNSPSGRCRVFAAGLGRSSERLPVDRHLQCVGVARRRCALLIDLGDGSVLEQLPKIGVKRVEWVLFTHHHREQCQVRRAWRVRRRRSGLRPPSGRCSRSRPTSARCRSACRIPSQFTARLRASADPTDRDRPGVREDGHVPMGAATSSGASTRKGAVPERCRICCTKSGWLAFSGDVMLEGAKLHTWFDSEWDYGFAAGVWAAANSAGQVAGYDPEWLLPSHGPAIRRPAKQLSAFQDKLRQLREVANSWLSGFDLLRSGTGSVVATDEGAACLAGLAARLQVSWARLLPEFLSDHRRQRSRVGH